MYLNENILHLIAIIKNLINQVRFKKSIYFALFFFLCPRKNQANLHY
jgi:hypothetical protein